MAITPSQWSHVLTIPESYTPNASTSGQTLVITESVIAKLLAPDQSIFWSNVQNGGGDVRICEGINGSNQLPIEVVSLDSVEQTCVIWTRKPTYNGTGDLYVFIGKVGETQPPVTDPFGRNAVWQDNAAAYNLNDGSGTDSKGVNNLAVSGGLTTVDGVFGKAQRFSSSADSLQGSFSGLGTSQRTLKVWVRPDNTSENRYLSTFNGGARQNLTALIIGFQPGQFNVFDEGYVGGDASNSQMPATALQWQRLVYVWDGATLKGYIDGVEQISTPDTLFNQTPDFLRISPTSGGGANFYTGALQLFEALDFAQSPSYITTEHANQSDPANFFGTPTLATTGGAPSAGVTADTAFTVNAPSVSASASASLPNPVANANVTVNAPTVSASVSATFPQPSSDIAFAVNVPSVSAIASATQPNPSADIDYSISAPTVSASVSATLPNPVSDIALSVSAPSVSASVSVTEPSFNANVAFTVNTPTVSISTSATLPQPESTVSYTVSPPSVSAVAIVGGIAIIVDSETNINQRAMSTNISAPSLSTNIDAPILSNNING